MRRKRKKTAFSDGERFVKQVTLPVSDTVPAPGNFTVEVLNLYSEGLPVVDSTDLIDTLGAGTAEDVVSALQAPVPGGPAGEPEAAGEKEKDDQYLR